MTFKPGGGVDSWFVFMYIVNYLIYSNQTNWAWNSAKKPAACLIVVVFFFTPVDGAHDASWLQFPFKLLKQSHMPRHSVVMSTILNRSPRLSCWAGHVHRGPFNHTGAPGSCCSLPGAPGQEVPSPPPGCCWLAKQVLLIVLNWPPQGGGDRALCVQCWFALCISPD